MHYDVISADCHIDLCWLPTDLFTSNASAAMRDRVPYAEEAEGGPRWVTRNGAQLGRVNGMGMSGRDYFPGRIERVDRMAATGLYEDGKKGIRRNSDVDLRIKDQDLDGVQAEVLYGILGAAERVNDHEVAAEMMRIYNEWIADFCSARPDRFAGLACIPNHSLEAAIAEVERVGERGALRGIDLANSTDLRPLWDPYWLPLWEVVNATGLPLHVHAVAPYVPPHIGKIEQWASRRVKSEGTLDVPWGVARAALATRMTGFALHASAVLMAMIFSGVLERYPEMKFVLGESGIGWIPYVLERADAEWEEQFREDLSLTMPPSAYWHRQCYATYQTDPVGAKLVDELGATNIMWGSDFPHPDGIWPDSQEYIQKELGHLPEAVRRRIICDNARELYRFGS